MSEPDVDSMTHKQLIAHIVRTSKAEIDELEVQDHRKNYLYTLEKPLISSLADALNIGIALLSKSK